mmetsp:Transcript_25282/g.71300  ORF Transcript_25282/g.71300 Transcript_25282/m.71300 type:complete len:288 (+) Transcript_25282:738-1601(+)
MSGRNCILSSSTKIKRPAEAGAAASPPRTWHVIVHSSMNSPSPTWVLCSCSTAFCMLSAFLSHTCATRPRAVALKLTLETPPKIEKIRRTWCSCQLSGKPCTRIHGGSSSLGASACAGTAFLGAGATVSPLAPMISTARTSARYLCSASGVPMRWCREQTQCSGPASRPSARSSGPPSSVSPTKESAAHRRSCCMYASCATTAPATSPLKGPAGPCSSRSDRDHEPLTFPSSAPVCGKAAIKPAASSCVAKRTYPRPVRSLEMGSRMKMISCTAPKSSSHSRSCCSE